MQREPHPAGSEYRPPHRHATRTSGIGSGCLVRHHHERFDGGGYPDGLSGHKIPILARIVSVCDAYDALTSDRPYRARRNSEEAIETLMRGAGQQWDRELVSILLSELPAMRFEVAS
jgi:HD-GYP domain-containing protein (c-di-GMP phosphodiesterase class II)